MVAPAAKAERAAQLRVVAGLLWSGALILVLAFLVLYPVAMLLLGALTNTNPVVDGFGIFDLSLDNFISVLGNPNVHHALGNTLIACTGGTVLAVAIGLTFSWIVVRTNTPWKGFIGAASLIPLFVPPLVAAIAWSILGSPKSGLLNTLMKWAGLDLRIDVYTMTGLIVVFGVYYAPYVYMFTASALRNMVSEPGRGGGDHRRRTDPDAVDRHVSADRAGNHIQHAAVLHRDAGHLWHPGRAGRASQHLGADHLHFQAYQLEPPALQHGRGGGDHPHGGDRSAGGAATVRALGQELHHRRRQGIPASIPRSRTLALADIRSGAALPLRRGRVADAGSDRRFVPPLSVHS